MIGLLLLIGGLILMTVGSGWFTGAATVGVICVGVFVALLVLVLLFGLFGLSLTGRAARRMERQMNHW